jgi:hypothetical protein
VVQKIPRLPSGDLAGGERTSFLWSAAQSHFYFWISACAGMTRFFNNELFGLNFSMDYQA